MAEKREDLGDIGTIEELCLLLRRLQVRKASQKGAIMTSKIYAEKLTVMGLM